VKLYGFGDPLELVDKLAYFLGRSSTWSVSGYTNAFIRSFLKRHPKAKRGVEDWQCSCVERSSSLVSDSGASVFSGDENAHVQCGTNCSCLAGNLYSFGHTPNISSARPTGNYGDIGNHESSALNFSVAWGAIDDRDVISLAQRGELIVEALSHADNSRPFLPEFVGNVGPGPGRCLGIGVD
jgi:hypothetical protein